MKKPRLTIEDRLLIEELLRLNYKQIDIARAVDTSASTISREIKARRVSNKYGDICSKTERFPFICSNCSYKNSCRKKKFYYNYKEAQKDYDKKIIYSRIGIDMTIDEIQYWDDFFRDKIKDKNQPILHLFNNIKNEFPNQFKHFINIYIKVIFQVLIMKCLQDHLVINLEEKKKKLKLYQEITSLKNGVNMMILKST